MLTKGSSAVLARAQAWVSAYHTPGICQLYLPRDCQGRSAVSLLKITLYLSNTVEGRKDSQEKEIPKSGFDFSLWEKFKVPPKWERTFELILNL